MICYGINPLTEALKAGYPLQRIFVSRHKRSPALDEIQRLATRQSVPLEPVDDLRRYCPSNEHQGVCAIAPDAAFQPFHPDSGDVDRFVILDGLQDPHNFGAALRVCEVFGFRDVIFQEGNSCGVTAAAIKASSGAYFHLRLYRLTLNTAVRRLKEHGYAIIVLDGEGQTLLRDVVAPKRYCVVVGAEHKGVRFAIQRQADQIAKIPIAGQIESLNVSCALAVGLYELSRG